MISLAILPVVVAMALGDSGDTDFSRQCRSEWHQWRGPLASGVAPEGDPPVHWNQETNIKWKTRIPGEGASTPIVWGDRVFVLTAVKTNRLRSGAPRPDRRQKTKPTPNYYQFTVICLGRETGNLLWKKIATEEVPHEGHHPTHTYASASPTTDGQWIYASFGSRGVFCYDFSGELRWSRDLGDMRTRYGWGEAVSPVIHDNRVVVNWDNEDQSFIVVLDATSGETKWRTPRDEPTSWATPLVVDHRGRTQVIVNGTNRVRSYDLTSGQVIWQCGGQTLNVIPSPVTVGDLVICMSGYRGNAAYAISLDSTGELTGTEKITWIHDRGTPYVPSPILYGDRIYFTRTSSAVLSCLEVRTGKPVGEVRRLPGLSGNLYASPVGARGRIYFVDRDGTTLVIKNSPELEVLATNRLDDPIDASPAIVGKQIFLRGKEHLYCIEKQ